MSHGIIIPFPVFRSNLMPLKSMVGSVQEMHGDTGGLLRTRESSIFLLA